ncbi:hypothetical protein L0337_10105 [candidate division KSB1 bacterium]|nr:hypothetical protein [candidate division KSB1 bacterium]
MREKLILPVLFIAIAFCIAAPALKAQPPKLRLSQTFDLAGKRSQVPQYFLMESKLINYALDGKRTGTTIYRLRLKCTPAKLTKTAGEEYTCVRFTVQQSNGSEVEIPALKNWAYIFHEPEVDEKGQLFGIDHAKFENLTDSAGKPLPSDQTYHVYNAFIDFHSFCNVFAERAAQGSGIQDLKKIGQKIVHSAAFSEPPVNLGSKILPGSSFKNGQITLEFKGLSIVNGKQCALVEYDSGESSFKMLMQPTPELKIQTVGSSHYFGDIYKDLSTNWVQKATMIEFVVAEVALPMPPNKLNTVIERRILILNVSADEFSSQLQ